MKIYVAGPMTGKPGFNFPAFYEATARLRAAGHEVFNPAENDSNKYGDRFASTNGDPAELEGTGFSMRSALGDDLAWICAHADAVAVLPGWEASKGANAEVATARALKLLVGPVEDFA